MQRQNRADNPERHRRYAEEKRERDKAALGIEGYRKRNNGYAKSYYEREQEKADRWPPEIYEDIKRLRKRVERNHKEFARKHLTFSSRTLNFIELGKYEPREELLRILGIDWRLGDPEPYQPICIPPETRTSICGDCIRTDCSWSRNGTPVRGWKAEKTVIRNSTGGGKYLQTKSYRVTDCPLFTGRRVKRR